MVVGHTCIHRQIASLRTSVLRVQTLILPSLREYEALNLSARTSCISTFGWPLGVTRREAGNANEPSRRRSPPSIRFRQHRNFVHDLLEYSLHVNTIFQDTHKWTGDMERTRLPVSQKRIRMLSTETKSHTHLSCLLVNLTS